MSKLTKNELFTPEGLLEIPGVGKQRVQYLNKLGIKCIYDLLYHLPRKYENRAYLEKLDNVSHDSTVSILAPVKKVELVKMKGKKSIFKAQLENDWGKITAVWFNQPFLKGNIKPGIKIFVTGKVNLKYGRQINVSDYEIWNEDKEHPYWDRIVPIYPSWEKIPSKLMRKIIYAALEGFLPLVEDVIPENVRFKYSLLDIKAALKEIHFPTNGHLFKKAKYRLIFEELLILQLGIKINKKQLQESNGIKHPPVENLTAKYLKSLPYPLTNGQKKVIHEIKKDMESKKVMYRLIQGDVGSGKTAVALWALIKAVSGGYQGALMAPTEILAEQHFQTMAKIVKPLGIKISLLTGSLTPKEKERRIKEVLTGKVSLIIGTHVLFQKNMKFANLGLIVIDEQHRFGVKQRLALQDKGINPDILVMTATPIPRSLALTLFGDLDISIIDQLPPGRSPVKTYHVGENMKNRIYNFIKKEVNMGNQAYIVCPLVEESESIPVENVSKLAGYLKETFFSNLEIGLIHGKMPSQEKEEVMAKFHQGTIKILVATSVIEVGVNVPNATIMVIENAERFGLAQLHQLRGRVGRGQKQSYCILISDPKTKIGMARMEIMTRSSDGFLIAEEDLRLRGPGDFFGIKQHGLPELKIADIVRDKAILEETRKLADRLIKEGFQEKYKSLYDSVQEKFNQNIYLNA